MFPQNLKQFKCSTPNCDGLRFVGSEARQLASSKQPQKSFILADASKPLASLIKTSGKEQLLHIDVLHGPYVFPSDQELTDHVDLWITKIKKPMVLCAQICA